MHFWWNKWKIADKWQNDMPVDMIFCWSSIHFLKIFLRCIYFYRYWYTIWIKLYKLPTTQPSLHPWSPPLTTSHQNTMIIAWNCTMVINDRDNYFMLNRHFFLPSPLCCAVVFQCNMFLNTSIKILEIVYQSIGHQSLKLGTN